MRRRRRSGVGPAPTAVATALLAGAMLVGAMLVGTLAMPSGALAKNMRCPNAQIAPTASAAQIAKIEELWAALSEAPATKAEGPLGCPIAGGAGATSPGWDVAQRFQRGWILVEQHFDQWRYFVAVRGVAEWSAWWHWPGTRTAAATTSGSGAGKSRERAIESTTTAVGERFATMSAGSSIALFRCPASVGCGDGPPQDVTEPTDWLHATIELTMPPPPDAVFDFGAHLQLEQIIDPATSTFAERRRAAFPAWLGCHVRNPARSRDGTAPPIQGEFDMAALVAIMQRKTPCPITGEIPAQTISGWLEHAQLPPGGLPGTSSDTAPCKRDGDLDVTLLGLMHVYNANRARIGAVARAHLRDILRPWGGKVRADPYVAPDGRCLGSSLLESENHLLMTEAGRYLIDAFLVSQGETNTNYDATTNGTRDWLLRFIRLLVRRDFYEYNSLPYGRYSSKALYILNDYAPDPEVRLAARSALDWLYAKWAVSENMRRASRPFRRQPLPERYADSHWVGGGGDVLSLQSKILAGGGFQYLLDPANMVAPAQAQKDFEDLGGHLRLASFTADALAELADIADTSYRPPGAVMSWLAGRYRDDDAVDHNSYLQVFNHHEGGASDHDRFVQSNEGIEVYSGNRNWTISAGGVDVPPSDPASPPGTWATALYAAGAGALALGILGAIIGSVVPGIGTLLGALAGALIGFFAGLIGGALAPSAIQTSSLWDTQPGVMRETSLTPSGSALDRSQTLRYEQPYVASRDTDRRAARICVAEGFMCGFDFRWPSNPFPGATDAAKCAAPRFPDRAPVKLVYDDAVARNRLGCLLGAPAGTGYGKDWRRWTFATGQIVVNIREPDPLKASWGMVDVQTPDPAQPEVRRVHARWSMPTQPFDWWEIPAYRNSNHTDRYLRIEGDPDNPKRHNEGSVVYEIPDPDDKSPLHGGTSDTSWDIGFTGCRHTTSWIVLSSHECEGDVIPPLSVNIAPLPLEPLACEHDELPLDDDGGNRATVLTIGCGGRFGMYVYILNKGCSSDECPPGTRTFGFVIAAPSRGWSQAAFATKVTAAIRDWERTMGDLEPGIEAEVLVPYSSDSDHRLRFAWNPQDRLTWAIRSDSGAAGGLVSRIGQDVEKWPPAASSVANDGRPMGELIDQPDRDGCFTVTGMPTDAPRPAMVVDFRQWDSPIVKPILPAAARTSC